MNPFSSSKSITAYPSIISNSSSVTQKRDYRELLTGLHLFLPTLKHRCHVPRGIVLEHSLRLLPKNTQVRRVRARGIEASNPGVSRRVCCGSHSCVQDGITGGSSCDDGDALLSVSGDVTLFGGVAQLTNYFNRRISLELPNRRRCCTTIQLH